jgi:hypothetical protein
MNLRFLLLRMFTLRRGVKRIIGSEHSRRFKIPGLYRTDLTVQKRLTTRDSDVKRKERAWLLAVDQGCTGPRPVWMY